jgi:NAD(P)-dependent dehydrogenase (short-subunit alcohol dehydrogenase family)
MSTEQKVVVITGAANGIGAASARLLHQNGYQLVISDINLEGATSLSNALNNARNSSSIAVQTDVSNHSEMELVMKKAFDHFGRIDVLVNNAGIGPKKMARVADADLDDWDRVIAVNQSGVFYGMKYVLPFMVNQGYGNIINIASLAGQVASPNNIAYSASKFAVVGMTKTTALEYGRKNIRVNALCPGYTETELLNQLHEAKPELKEGLRAAAPMNRYGKVEEIAEAVLWLASDKSSFITGQTITLDGGISL